MKNFKAKVSYLGKLFYGFSIQKKVVTVQGEIEKAICEVTGQKVRVVPAGRTDAGVHASGQIISFKIKTKLKAAQLKKALNANLAEGIIIENCVTVNARFHARYSAKSRTYVYNLLCGDFCPLYLKPFVWRINNNLNLAAMEKAAKKLVGCHDFASFSIKEKNKTYVRELKKIKFKTQFVNDFLGLSSVLKVRLISITFKANAYARGMIRGIMGTLEMVGQGKISIAEFEKIFKARDRRLAGKSAPAKGLCLVEVEY